ncbi:hypothetical protein RhiJN_08068 [Ceratobasidium sp. AG-Ba]|nr:hypothetical protein RhiJN_08068 [Ceratobasidium sp. AG-Ba]
MSKPSLHTTSYKERKEYQDFLKFKVMKAARDTVTESETVLSSGSGSHHQNPTIGRTSKPDSPNQALRGRSTHSTIPASSGKDNQTADERLVYFRYHDGRNYRVDRPLSAREGVSKLLTSTPPALSEQDDTTLTLDNDSPTSPLSSTPPCHTKVIDWPSSIAHPVHDSEGKDKKLGPSLSSTHDLSPAPAARPEEARREAASSRSAKSRPSAPNPAEGKRRAEPPEPTAVYNNENDKDNEEMSRTHQRLLTNISIWFQAIQTFKTNVKARARQYTAAKSSEPTAR